MCVPEVFSDHAICMFHLNTDILCLLGTAMAITALLSCKYFTHYEYFQACLHIFVVIYVHSFIPLECAEFNDSLPFSGASSIPLCYVLFSATLPLQLFFHPLSPHLAIYFLVYLSILFPNSHIILFWESYFLPFSIHVQTNVIYLTSLSLL